MTEQGRPRVVVTALLFSKDAELLLLQSREWGDKYIIPGGGVEYGETVEQSLCREVKEETGLEVVRQDFLFLVQGIELAECVKKKHAIYLVHRCLVRDGEVVLNDETQDFIWAKSPDVLSLDLNRSSRETIKEVIAGGYWPVPVGVDPRQEPSHIEDKATSTLPESREAPADRLLIARAAQPGSDIGAAIRLP